MEVIQGLLELYFRITIFSKINKVKKIGKKKLSYQPGKADSSGGDSQGSTGNPEPLQDNLCGSCEK